MLGEVSEIRALSGHRLCIRAVWASFAKLPCNVRDMVMLAGCSREAACVEDDI